MSTGGLFGISLAQSPFYGSPFYVELKAGWGSYASTFSNDIYYAKNGWWYSADASYKSNYQKFLVGAKAMIGKDFRTFRGFATPQFGLMRMASKTIVKYWDGSNNNTNENSDGSSQVSKKAISQTGFCYGGEVGLDIAVQQLFNKGKENNTIKLHLSGSFLRGLKEYSYAHANKLLNPEQFNDEGSNQTNFVLISHPNVDEVKYTEVYKSALQLWGINLGVSINL